MRFTCRICTLIVLLAATVILSGAGDVRGAYAPDHPEYPRLTSRLMGMGGAGTAWIDDASSIFHNPAGMGRIRTLSVSNAHSRNHFPGARANLDQLDCDPTSFIVPLNGGLFGYPIGSAGAGWVLHGELGYDYLTRNDESIPQERLFGMGPGDRCEGAGFHLWPGGYFGFSHRTSEYLFDSTAVSGLEIKGSNREPGVTSLEDLDWRRTGEGYTVGLQQTVIPGLQYGTVVEQMDYDYLPYRDGVSSERTKSRRSGWSIRPTAWLLIARDVEAVSRKEWPSKEEKEILREMWGVEIQLGPWFAVRWGSFDGHPTSGWSYKIGPWRRDSAWVDGFMYEMVGDFPTNPAPLDDKRDISDYHATGFNFGG